MDGTGLSDATHVLGLLSPATTSLRKGKSLLYNGTCSDFWHIFYKVELEKLPAVIPSEPK